MFKILRVWWKTWMFLKKMKRGGKIENYRIPRIHWCGKIDADIKFSPLIDFLVLNIKVNENEAG